MNMGDMYAKNLTGLVQCYVMAIPFFGNTLVGDLFYSVMMFGGYKMAVKVIESLTVKVKRF